MRLKDFSFYLIIVFSLTFGTWVFIGFLSMGYEDGVDKSNFGKTCYKIASLLNFSGEFWQELIPSSVAIILSILTTSVLFIGLTLLINRLFIGLILLIKLLLGK